MISFSNNDTSFVNFNFRNINNKLSRVKKMESLLELWHIAPIVAPNPIRFLQHFSNELIKRRQ